ncbi:MAG: DUF4390 domain-containing protein [Zoogloeaceae bacterium]|jgi:hypothetical protein|nr:DUF4390 domain-containing protein [Zoogloeaceae bacterium]
MAEFPRRLLLLIAFLAFMPANADDGHITRVEIVPAEEGYVLNADFDFELNPRLTDALAHGLALHFIAELRVERPRWYWFNKTMSNRRVEYRLSYHAITRRYRLTIGSLHQSFEKLKDAVRTMQHIRHWHVASAETFTPGVQYEAELRFFHDTSQLPKLFQLSAVTNGSWEIDTGWMEWVFLPAAATPQ